MILVKVLSKVPAALLGVGTLVPYYALLTMDILYVFTFQTVHYWLCICIVGC